jgi:hypothetical protein
MSFRLALAGVSALAVAAAAWLSVRDGSEPSVASAQAANGGTVAAQAAGADRSPAAPHPTLVATGAPAAIEPRAAPEPGANPAAGATPPGIAPAHWQRLQAELGSRADGATELARLRAYLEYADTLKRFQALKAQPGGSSELAALATVLDAGLAERQRQRELHGAEAYQVKRAVLEVLEPDATAREQRLAAWQAAQAAPAVARATDVRDAEFLRQQQTLIAAWTAQPPALRDRAQLERDLQALRQRIYRPVGS